MTWALIVIIGTNSLDDTLISSHHLESPADVIVITLTLAFIKEVWNGGDVPLVGAFDVVADEGCFIES